MAKIQIDVSNISFFKDQVNNQNFLLVLDVGESNVICKDQTRGDIVIPKETFSKNKPIKIGDRIFVSDEGEITGYMTSVPCPTPAPTKQTGARDNREVVSL